jgi:hypothetical protein
MGVPNASHMEMIDRDSFSLWNNIAVNLEEFVLGNWCVCLVALLLVFSLVKHSIMCWEVRQDKRRLRCCYIRHRALLHAAKQQREQQQQQQDSKPMGSEGEESVKETDADSCHCGSSALPIAEADAAVSADGAEAAAPKKGTPVPTVTVTANVPTSSSLPRLKRPSTLSVSTAKTEEEDEVHSRVSSLQLPLTSTSSSDFSFSLSPMSVTHQAAAATSRLLNRLTLAPGSLEAVPAANSESSTKLPPTSSPSEFVGRRNGCFPRYTEDEQRLIDEKRQANMQAWMEAKRALESTENLASCSATPTSSTTRRKSVLESGSAVKDVAF